MPTSEFDSFNNLKGNVQSRLLQSVKESIKKTYPNTDIRADGQIIKIYFSDEIIFEILPAFKRWDNIFVYPDTNMGGNWMSTNPKAEQEAIKEKNRQSNGLLVSTCGVHSVTTKRNFVEILRFKLFHDYFAFQEDDQNNKRKVLKKHFNVSVVVDLVSGDTRK